ncbi:Calcineurin-like phosphoesterase superfamily domain-containing protein [Tenacibaculum sp. 190524A02b]|uniref:metallophosphoesterase family protein n=1 Tax=Tenacibaculum vairaonense TaxID=3137860 RepID=UPI0032B2FD96
MDKKTIDLGTIKGKLLLFGGVYSNLQALEALINIAEQENILPENCFCTGDIIGYCAQPEQTLGTFIKWGAQSIIGNVEQQLRNGDTDCGCDFKAGTRCDTFSKSWYPFAQQQLSKTSIDWMQSLPDHISFTYNHKKCTIVHGSYQHISEFVFKSTPWNTKQASFTATDSTIIIAGHCGLPFTHTNKDNLWINPGVIGMPANNGKPHVWYAIIDDTNGFNYTFKTLNYNYKEANRLMTLFGLPNAYAKTLISGIWDNMEILPTEERQWKNKDLTTLINN